MSIILNGTRVAVVTGDITMDWNLTASLQDQRQVRAQDGNSSTHISWQRGGAALLADLIDTVNQQLAPTQASWKICQTGAPRRTICPNDTNFNHAFALWMEKEKKIKSKEKAWRVDTFLGLHPSIQNCQGWMQVIDDTPEAALVVLDDADLYFRKFEEIWPSALKTPGQNPWVLLKASNRVVDGSLWSYLLNNHAEHLIVLMKAEDLRKVKVGEASADNASKSTNNEVQVSRELSWEAAVEDLIWEINHNPTIKDLLRCAHLIVSFGTGGAVLVSRDLNTPGQSLLSTNTLIYDPNEIENSWEANYPGHMIAGTTCLAAGLARQIMLNPDRPDFRLGIKTGLYAMRRLHEEGYQKFDLPECGKQLQFPLENVAKFLSTEKPGFAEIEVYPPTMILSTEPGDPDPELLRLPYWTILREVNKDHKAGPGKDQEPKAEKEQQKIFRLSRNIVLNGVEKALENVPVGKFRNLTTVDRREIEGFRSIRTLISEYIEKDNPGKPLSIAVFGAPGAGKSFGIKEVANSISDQIEEKTFNLSQFAAEEDLRDALHQVRDIALSGKIPLIFWDEFDTSFQKQMLGWLRFFLSPMQDGSFQDGQITHPIGRCIFVFAGGTSSTMEAFKNRDTDEERTDEKKRADTNAFKDVKGPDFVSRLKGFINIMGPNPVRQPGDTPEQARSKDPYYQIRRAVLIRSMFARKYKNLLKNGDLQIDRGLLRAMLDVSEYTHGARSIESVMDMSTLTDKDYFDRSSLPVPALLNLHVNADQFMQLLQMIEWKDQDRIERMAKAVHEAFCHQRRKEGCHYGKTYQEGVYHPALLDYDDPRLDEIYRSESRKNASDIMNKVERLGYGVRQARSVMIQYQFSENEIEQLARWEHTRWMISKLQDGWKWAPNTDKSKKENQCLLFWNPEDLDAAAEFTPPFTREQMDEWIRNGSIGSAALPENEKEVDRNMVREIPVILAKAGCTIQKSVI
jgi:hypothetical protein